MTRRPRPPGRPSAPLLLAIPLIFLAFPASALETDRLAVELLAGETPVEAALSFERACLRIGAILSRARAVQTFEHGGARFVRLAVEGSPLALQCLSGLQGPRRGADGTVRWLDGFVGALVVPAAEPPDRIPEAVFANPAGALPEPPGADPAFTEALAAGDAQALERLAATGLEAALAQVEALASRGGPGALASLETAARGHAHWRVRRAAVEALDASISFAAVAELARRDPAWEVRHGAVDLLGLIADAPLALGSARGPEAAELLLELATHDAAWEVRQHALWQLSTALVGSHRERLAELARTDAHPRVRAAALGVLAGAGLLDRTAARAALADATPAVRTVGAQALVALMREEDVPALWQAMRDEATEVRLAAAAVLDRLDDPTLAAPLWALYVREADQLDADPTYLSRIEEFLARNPAPELGPLVAARADLSLPEPELRRVGRLLSIVSPPEALRRWLPWLQGDATRRAFAADVLPDLPPIRTARLALLSDPDDRVRAGAVLGLCRSEDPSLRERVASVELEPEGLGLAATRALARCGDAAGESARFQTRLEGAQADDAPVSGGGRWTAGLAIALLLASVVALKLWGAPVVPSNDAPPDESAAPR